MGFKQRKESEQNQTVRRCDVFFVPSGLSDGLGHNVGSLLIVQYLWIERRKRRWRKEQGNRQKKRETFSFRAKNRFCAFFEFRTNQKWEFSLDASFTHLPVFFIPSLPYYRLYCALNYAVKTLPSKPACSKAPISVFFQPTQAREGGLGGLFFSPFLRL